MKRVHRALVTATTASEPPGSAYAYSNTGYLLLGRIVEKVTGRPYGKEIERRVIQPLRLLGDGRRWRDDLHDERSQPVLRRG
jgi:CubicO group peptidase (beta-lactamase class C family)